MSELQLALGASARSWADDLHRFTTDHGGALVRVRIMSERDAVEQDYDVLIADDTASFLSTRLVSVLRAQNKGIIGVCEPRERVSATEFLSEMGVQDVLSDDLGPETFLELAKAVAVIDRPAPTVPQPSEEPSWGTDRRLVAVVGCSGGVGATEVALGLSQNAESEGLLVDLDVVFPALAQRLGLALHPNLRSALDAHRHSPDELLDQVVALSGGFKILPGVVSAGDWAGMRPQEVAGLLDELLCDSSLVVNLPLPSADRSTTALAKRVLGQADDVVVVTVPTPVGVTRLIEWTALWGQEIEGKVHVVFNRSPKSLFKRNESFQEAVRAVAADSIVFVPVDQGVQRANWQGDLIPKGKFRRALAGVELSGIHS